jgi:hypothetical protein
MTPGFPQRARRILFVFGALLLAVSAQAEWVLFGRDEAIRFYFDPKSIVKNGDSAQILQILDFTSAQWVDAQTVVGSLKMLIEYDCAKPRLRALASESYSEQMGDGRLVSKDRFADPPWDAVQPGTTPDKIRQIACTRK